MSATDFRAAVATPHAAPEAQRSDGATSTSLQSAIYEGWVRHRRHAPHAHAFRYRLCMLYLDLSEIDRVFDGRRLWSAHGRAVGEFRRSDYFGDPKVPLDRAVRDRVESETGQRPSGPIRLLTHPRYFGFVFNPVSFYYCYADDGETLEAILAEITNTPWRERHAYVLPVAEAERHGSALAWSFAKRFHVSPFMPIERDYAWRFTPPAQTLHVHMNVTTRPMDGATREFDATLVLQRRALDGRGLARALWRYPLMTLRVLFAIHWQALLIFLRRNPVYDHPRNRPAPQDSNR